MIQTVKLSKLRLSPINVRTVSDDQLCIPQMAADIEARGLLQNLLVTPVSKPRGTFEVFDGGRRLRALLLLAERGTIDANDYDVPVLVVKADVSALSETSLAANFQQLKLTAAEECRAFQHFLGVDGDIAAVATRFGISSRFVEGRLRLANLAEPIFDALAAGKMTLDMAKAYASTESHERQLMVWNSYGAGSSYHGPDTIRRVIANETMKASDPVAKLVGAGAYTAAGGAVDRDLFSDDGDKWTNPEIAQTLAAALMEAEARRIGEEQGLGWIRPIAGNSTWDASRDLHRVNLPTLPLSEADEARLDAIETRLGEIEEAMEQEEIEEAAYQALDAKDDALREEARTISQRAQILPPELAPRIGTFLTLNRDGQMVLETTYYSETPLRITMIEPEESEAADIDASGETSSEGSDGGADTPPEAPRPTFRIEEGATTTTGNGPGRSGTVDPDAAAPGGKALSQTLLDQLSVQRRDVLGAALIANPSLALDYMLFAMADARAGNTSGGGTTIRATTPQDPVLSKDVPGTRARDYLAEVHHGLDASWTASGDKVVRFEAFRLLDDDAKAAWLAWLVATSLEAKEACGSHRQNAMQNRLATILDIDVASWWRPTSENFFDRVPKGALLSLLDDVGGPALSGRHASQKKTEISTSCQKLFAGEAIVEPEVKQTALAWVPAAMRFNDTAVADEPDANSSDDGEAGELASLLGGEDDAHDADPGDGLTDNGSIEGDDERGGIDDDGIDEPANDYGVNDTLIAAE